jgi:DNA polymerase V
MAIVDRVNARYGRHAMSFARSDRQRAWKLRSKHHSPRHTASWDELLRI